MGYSDSGGVRVAPVAHALQNPIHRNTVHRLQNPQTIDGSTRGNYRKDWNNVCKPEVLCVARLRGDVRFRRAGFSNTFLEQSPDWNTKPIAYGTCGRKTQGLVWSVRVAESSPAEVALNLISPGCLLDCTMS